MGQRGKPELALGRSSDVASNQTTDHYLQRVRQLTSLVRRSRVHWMDVRWTGTGMEWWMRESSLQQGAQRRSLIGMTGMGMECWMQRSWQHVLVRRSRVHWMDVSWTGTGMEWWMRE